MRPSVTTCSSTIKYIMRKSGTLCLRAVLLPAILIFCGDGAGTVFAQVFRGYYPGGGVQVQSKKQGKKEIIKGYYPDGKLEVVYEYENRKLNGTTRQYFENGVLKAEIRYLDNRRQGMAKYYYPSGMLMAKIEFDKDSETGNSRFYDENGRPMKARVK
jgi:antitoxin component YwqK of YwqJK toxin-antitoxin module